MKNRIKLCAAAMTVLFASGCAFSPGYDVYTGSAVPYSAFTEEELVSSECKINIGSEVSVNGKGAWFDGNEISITEGGVYLLSGSYDSGCINVSATEPVKLVLNNIYITNNDGFAILSSSERLIIESAYGSQSRLTGNGGGFNFAVYSAGDILFAGKGGMAIDGSVFSGEQIKFGRSVSTICGILSTSEGEIIPGSLYINQ